MWQCMDWINLAQYLTLANSSEHGYKLPSSIKFGESILTRVGRVAQSV